MQLEVTAVTDLQHDVIRKTAPVEHHRSVLVWWLAGGLIVSLLAVIGLGVWVYVEIHHQTSQASPTQPSAEVVALLDQRIAAMNAGDGAAAAALYAEDAVLDEIEGVPYPTATATYTFTGRDRIQARLQGLFEAGLRLEPVGEPIQLGHLVAEPARFLQAGGNGYGEGILVFEIAPEGTIEHQWMIGWVDSSG